LHKTEVSVKDYTAKKLIHIFVYNLKLIKSIFSSILRQISLLAERNNISLCDAF